MSGPESWLGRAGCELVAYVSSDQPSVQCHALLISSSSRNWDTVRVNVDNKTGALAFADNDDHVFKSMDDAKAYLKRGGRLYSKATGKYVLGCAVVGCYLWILLATDIDAKPAIHLPGDHFVFNITATQWCSCALQVASANPEADFRQGEMLAEFPVAGYHFFCDTVDITRPFPSSHAVTHPSWEFVWNHYLTQPFRACGLAGVSPHLCQGLAEACALSDMHGTVFTLALIARRSRLHAGTRYKARGLNSRGGPANEIECEQLVLLKEQQWASYVWRRGSVPLRWKQTVKANGVGTAIAIEGKLTFRGSRQYFRRMQRRYKQTTLPVADLAADGHLTDEQRLESRNFPIAVVNLLRKGSVDRESSEAPLYSAYCDLLTALQKECGLNVLNIGLDWHELSATHGELAPVVQVLWAAAEEHYKSFGCTRGYFAPRAEPGAADAGAAWGATLRAFKQSRQAGIMRINCADSLDRTNVASFYSAFQVLLEQCRELGLSVAHYRSVLHSARLPSASSAGDMAKAGKNMAKASKMFGSLASRVGNMMSNGANPGPLGATGKRADVPPESSGADTPEDTASASALVPKGDLQAADGSWWERRLVDWPKDEPTGKRSVYINHSTKATSWKPPMAWQSWELLKVPVESVRHLVMPQLLLAYRDLFRVSGDKNAELYTGSPAMHSSQLDVLLADGTAGHGVAGFFNNAHTAVTRRIKNIMTDERTHAIFERFLGLPLSSADAQHAPATAPPSPTTAQMAADAQALPVCDAADSDDDADILAGRPWPPRSPHGGGSAPVSPESDGGGPRAAATDSTPPFVALSAPSPRSGGAGGLPDAPRAAPSLLSHVITDDSRQHDGNLPGEPLPCAPTAHEPALPQAGSNANTTAASLISLDADSSAAEAHAVPGDSNFGEARFDGFEARESSAGEEWSDDKLEPASLI